MKRILLSGLICGFLLLVSISRSQAQCAAGYISDTLNWDYLDFLSYSGSSTSYVSLAQTQTQRYTFGTEGVTVTHNYDGSNTKGDNTNHTADATTYGLGADVQFVGNGQVTFTFTAPVRNIRFSISDIDQSQRVNVQSTANVNLTTLAGTILTLTNDNTTNARASASANNSANSSVSGTVNVDIAGPVSSFTITVTNTGTATGEDGSFYISDVSGCMTGTFTHPYYHIAKPFTGQPAYVITVRNDTIYYTDVASGRSKFLFKDPNHDRLNSVAYDPYRHMVYYSYSLSGPGGSAASNDYILRRYDYDMDTLGIVSNDIRTLGIPLYDQSIESGAAAFYDGKLYLGIEGGSGVSDRESVIWRVDLNSSYALLPQAKQVFSVPSNSHDWSDIGINNGILYDFDGSSSEDFYHKNMVTGNVIRYAPSPSSLVPRQTGVDWNGTIYNVGSSSTIAAGTIAPYNLNGMVNTAQQYNITFNGVAQVGSWGDAAEAFKPKTDFGDAPATYDPASGDPGTHEVTPNLKLGVLTGIEWAKKAPFNGTGDGAEEDGVTGPQVISTGVSNFLLGVSVFNNTGSNATLVGWVDSNRDGVFQAAEGVSANVPSSASQQTINLLWPNINMPYTPGTTTYMRLRITSAAYGMTTANPTGFYETGEIEDFLLTVTVVLPDQNVNLKVIKSGSAMVSLVWNVDNEEGIDYYELQRSSDSHNWNPITNRTAEGNLRHTAYSFLDVNPDMPTSYFRVMARKNTGEIKYSHIKKVEFKGESEITFSPNPTRNDARLDIRSQKSGMGSLVISDFSGKIIYSQVVKLNQGLNSLSLPFVQSLSSGIYRARVQLDDETLVASLVVIK